ncbi:ubiquinol-cytochrome c reductase iron-sulfur subunit N-terminal domain-containing protein [Streptomyces odontomachi]|uniref:ubiquinol-cytochrome c reductase iron-sulfur subunit N-terminal domain-containing protein n=1 Tax=Streptomyces odontomachi TaxID=2944940 RepID=UPI00210CCF52|nr:ubiquinol-cytochrome c reductase iron-sulfur subunit N-terminal domain-containing protein [Streptomyces sp. ODS25]
MTGPGGPAQQGPARQPGPAHNRNMTRRNAIIAGTAALAAVGVGGATMPDAG